MSTDLTPPKRPLLRYHGGKWMLAPWVISHMPEHRVYTEAFGGAASVLLRKPRAFAEVYNDKDGEIVNLLRVARDNAKELVRVVELTPFARDEFNGSYEPSADPLEQARRTLVRCSMGFGSSAMNTAGKTGFRGSSSRLRSHPGMDWARQPLNLPAVSARLSAVIIENREAEWVLQAHDAPTTLHYVDPPYVPASRTWHGAKSGYKHEMTEADHVKLLALLRGLKGMVMVSGYPSEMYDAELRDWRRVERPHLGCGAVKRTEVLWMKGIAPKEAE